MFDQKIKKDRELCMVAPGIRKDANCQKQPSIQRSPHVVITKALCKASFSIRRQSIERIKIRYLIANILSWSKTIKFVKQPSQILGMQSKVDNAPRSQKSELKTNKNINRFVSSSIRNRIADLKHVSVVFKERDHSFFE